MFDTHCHLNFKAFDGKVREVIETAKQTGVISILVPGTDIYTSKKAAEIAEQFENIYAAVGIHPHHIYEFTTKKLELRVKDELKIIEKLLIKPKVAAVGEVGIDRYYYRKTKYTDYSIDESFIELQKEFLRLQIHLALEYKKSLILHNREAKRDLLPLLKEHWDKSLEGRTVFHCCEPDKELLEFAKNHTIFIGVDGDVTYWEQKQEFIKTIPLELLVLETDSPFLLPEPFRTESKVRPANEPKNIPLIANFVAVLLGMSIENLAQVTTENAKRLFRVF